MLKKRYAATSFAKSDSRKDMILRSLQLSLRDALLLPIIRRSGKEVGKAAAVG